MGSDGASVMLGSENGVATLFWKYSPWLFAVHCYGHRLELAFKDVIKKVPLLERLNVLLYGLYYFYHRSPLNSSNLTGGIQGYWNWIKFGSYKSWRHMMGWPCHVGSDECHKRI